MMATKSVADQYLKNGLFNFKDQVLETVMSHFAIHSIAAASLYDLPAVAESTWHGACLACAEMARRSLVSDQHLPTLIEWTTKVLGLWTSDQFL